MGSHTRCLCFPQHRGPPASVSLPEGPSIHLWPGRWTLATSPHSRAPSPLAGMLGPGPAPWPAQDSPRTLENAAGDTRPSQGNRVTSNNRVAHQSTVAVETPAGHLYPWSASSFLRSRGEHQPCPGGILPAISWNRAPELRGGVGAAARIRTHTHLHKNKQRLA